MTPAEQVVDASAAIRGLTTDGDAADLLVRITEGVAVGHAPDLIVAEVSSALAVAVRTERRSLDDARNLLELFIACPIERHPSASLAVAALDLTATSELSAYDALYAVLAEGLRVPLVTADRRLAAAVPGAMLLD